MFCFVCWFVRLVDEWFCIYELINVVGGWDLIEESSFDIF